MIRSFHVVRERIVREIILCQAEDEDAACGLAGDGRGEILDSTEESSVLNVEETVHSKRRQQEKKVARVAIPTFDEGSMGDELTGETPKPSAPALLAQPAPQPPVTPQNEGDWYDMVPGDIPEAGDEYRLNSRYPWEPVTRSLIGHAITKQTRAQFRARRYR